MGYFTVRNAAAAALWLAFAAGGNLGAQDFTWNRPGTSGGNFSDPLNWLGGTAPPTGGGTDLALAFTNSAPLVASPATATALNDLAGPLLLNRLDLDTRFGSTGSTPLGLVVGGSNPIRFVTSSLGAAPTITIRGAAARLTLPVEFAADTTIAGPGHGNVVFAGTVSGAGKLIHNRTSGLTGTTYVLGNQLGFYGGQTIFNGNNTFTGGVELLGGNIAYSIPVAGNTPFGTGTLFVNGTATSPSTLRMDAFSSNPLPNPIQVNTVLYYTGSNSGTFSGTITGPGDWVASGLTTTFQNPLTLTGRLVADGGPFRSSSGTIALANNATALAVSGIVIGPSAAGGLTLDNTAVNNGDRIANGLVVRSTRAVVTLTGNASAHTSETIGGLSGSGYETIGITGGTGVSSTLTLSATDPILRANSMMLFARGLNLGQNDPGTANAQNILLANPGSFTGSLVGNAASLNSTTALDVPVVPWGVGVLAAAGNPSQAAGTFLTYHATRGIRPLPVAQFATAISNGSTTQDNVRLTGAATAITSATTINSLVIANATGAGGVTGSGTLTVTGNAVLAVLATGASAALGNVTFPGEAYITAFGGNGLEVQGTLTAPSLVKAGTGVVSILSPLAVPGPLTLQVGQLSFDDEAKLGTVSEIRLNGGILRPFVPNGSLAITKPIFVSNTGGIVSYGNSGLGQTTAVTIQSVIANMPWSGGSVALPGQASGSVQFSGFGSVTLTADNTYSSNTILSGTTTLIVSRDANLGLGDQINIEGSNTLRTTASFATGKSLVLNGGSGDMTLSPDAGTTLTWNGPIHQRGTAANAFALSKTGGGTLVVAHAQNTFGGLLRINAGTVRLAGNLAPLNSAGLNAGGDENFGVLVNAGATLTGTGNANRAIFVDGLGFPAGPVGGTLAPGNGAAGTLAANGASIAADGNFRIRIVGGTPAPPNSGGSGTGPATDPASHSFLHSPVGRIAFDAGANIVIDGTGTPFTLGQQYSYAIASVGPQGTVAPVSIADPLRFTAIGFEAENPSLTTTANSVILNFTPVPEPAMIGFAAAVLGAFARFRRRFAR
jgi:autotransporter-associated beta strand protein